MYCAGCCSGAGGTCGQGSVVYDIDWLRCGCDVWCNSAGTDVLSDMSDGDEDRDFDLTNRSPAPLDLTDQKFLPPGGMVTAVSSGAVGTSDTPSAGIEGLDSATTAAERAGLVASKKPAIRPTPDAPLQQVLFAEFIGTFFLVFMCSACVFVGSIMTYDALTTDKILYVSLGYGLMHGLLVYTLSFPYQYDDMLWEHTRHMNPAITLVLLMLRRIHIRRAWKYWVVQALGAMSATFVLFCCTPPYPMGSMETLKGTGYQHSFTMSLVCTSTVLFVLLTTTFTVPNARSVCLCCVVCQPSRAVLSQPDRSSVTD